MLKTIFNYGRIALALSAATAAFVGSAAGDGAAVVPVARAQAEAKAETAPAAPAADSQRATQQVAALIDYIAADYPQAVRDGHIVEASEYEEQKNLLSEAQKLAAALPAPGWNEAIKQVLLTQIEAVAQAMEAKAAGPDVLARCRAVRQTLKDGFALRMVPSGPVSAVRAAEQFKTMCATCHGPTGHADTPAAQALKPPPVSFHDEGRMAQVAPALAFHTLTFGVAGTGMAAFDQLPAHERWNLAFFVVALRHGTPGEQPSLPESEQTTEAVKRLSDPALLAEMTDSELLTELGRSGLDDSAQDRALAYLRASAPFSAASAEDEDDSFAAARELLGQLRQAVTRGDAAAAHRLAIAAYLDGIEPHEASLRVSQPDAVPRIEATFMALRQSTDGGPLDVQRVLQQVQAAEQVLVELQHGKGSSKTTGFLAALIIALREGLEVALLIAALLAFLRKSGQGHLTRVVHAGWALAIPAGFLTFLLVGSLMNGARRELSEGILTLVAAAILVTMTHWVIGAKEARHWLGFLRRKVEAAGQTPAASDAEQKPRWLSGQALALLGLAFFAAYREAFETVLFYRALLLKVGRGAWHEVALGAALGGVAMIGVVVLFQRIGKRLNPRPVMLVSSLLLALLSLSLTGHGVHALQEGGYVGTWALKSWTGLPTLGLYPTWQGLGLQMAVLGMLLIPSLLDRLRAPKAAPPSRTSPAQAQPA